MSPRKKLKRFEVVLERQVRKQYCTEVEAATREEAELAAVRESDSGYPSNSDWEDVSIIDERTICVKELPK